VTTTWQRGVELLRHSLRGVDTPEATAEIANAEVCSAVFRSTRNLFQTYKLRRNWSNACLAAYERIQDDERENLQHILLYLERDTRFGYHSEAHAHMFNAEMVQKKIRALSAKI
jgi:hypothetical protein